MTGRCAVAGAGGGVGLGHGVRVVTSAGRERRSASLHIAVRERELFVLFLFADWVWQHHQLRDPQQELAGAAPFGAPLASPVRSGVCKEGADSRSGFGPV